MIPSFQRHLASVSPRNWLLILIFLCLVPFVNKAFFIDDTLFLRAAEQIQKHPLDFYGFNINWFDRTLPMSDSTENPPLASYYIALVAALAGWSEWTLHVAFLLPALAAGWAIYSLSRNYCRHPFVAALTAVLAPVYLVSATSVMCDVMLLAFWVWTLVMFEKGLRNGGVLVFVASGCLAGLAVWTKFFGLAVYGFYRIRHMSWWALAFIIPLLFAGAYEWLGFRLYGHDMFLSAAHYANHARTHSPIKFGEKTVIGLEFAGGCFLPALFYLPLLWSRRILLVAPCLATAGLLVIPHMIAFVMVLWRKDGSTNWGVLLQSAVLAVGGLYIILLVLADLWNKRDATSLLMSMWVFGVLVFTIGLNWTINGRSFLPAVPAIGILLARRLEGRHGGMMPEKSKIWPVLWPAIPAGIICLMLVKADYDLAGISRTAAKQLVTQYEKPGRQIWFQGHWGFQYYMELGGAKPEEIMSSPSRTGDIDVVPAQETEDWLMAGSQQYRLVEVKTYGLKTAFATLDGLAGAGFYAADLGPLPFTIMGAKPTVFWIYEVKNGN